MELLTPQFCTRSNQTEAIYICAVVCILELCYISRFWSKLLYKKVYLKDKSMDIFSGSEI